MTPFPGHSGGEKLLRHLASQSPGTERLRGPVLPGEGPMRRISPPSQWFRRGEKIHTLRKPVVLT